jgi:hypothetical protein
VLVVSVITHHLTLTEQLFANKRGIFVGIRFAHVEHRSVIERIAGYFLDIRLR